MATPFSVADISCADLDSPEVKRKMLVTAPKTHPIIPITAKVLINAHPL